METVHQLAIEDTPSCPTTSRWQNIDLGIVQTIIKKLFKNLSLKGVITSAIIVTLVLSVADTGSDMAVAYHLFASGSIYCGIAVVICDYLPGWELAVHNMCSDKWRKMPNLKEKIIALAFLTVSPLAVPLFHLRWLVCFESSDQDVFDFHHHNSRLTQLLAGSVEAPLQITVLFILWGMGKLPLPWSQNTEFIDSLGHKIKVFP